MNDSIEKVQHLIVVSVSVHRRRPLIQRLLDVGSFPFIGSLVHGLIQKQQEEENKKDPACSNDITRRGRAAYSQNINRSGT